MLSEKLYLKIWQNLSPFVFQFWRDLEVKGSIYQIGNKAVFKLRKKSVDDFILWEIWRLNEYEDKDFKISETDTVIDVGAHVGIFSVKAALKSSRGKVYSVEPLKENYAMLLQNKKLNRLDNLHIYNFALSNKKGHRLLYKSIFNTGMNSLNKNGNSKTERVRVTTLGNLMLKNNIKKVDLLKMDCEGGEYEIIFSLPVPLLKRIDKIIMEYHEGPVANGYVVKDLVSYLEKNGYEVRTHEFILQKYLFKTGFLKAWKVRN